MVAKLGLKLVNELGDEIEQVLCGNVFIQRSKLVDRLFRTGLAAGQQVGNDPPFTGVTENNVVNLTTLFSGN